MQTDRQIVEYQPTNPTHYITIEVYGNRRLQVRDWTLEDEDYKCRITGSDANRRGYHKQTYAYNYYRSRFIRFYPKAPRRYKLSELPLGTLIVTGHAKHPVANGNTEVDTLFFKLEDGTLGFCQAHTSVYHHYSPF